MQKEKPLKSFINYCRKRKLKVSNIEIKNRIINKNIYKYIIIKMHIN